VTDRPFLGGTAAPPPAHVAFFQSANRWGWPELAFWALAIAAFFLFPLRLPSLTQMATLGLFALSLDLILGYAGIVSLGHAAIFGQGAYAAGILAVRGWNEPVLGLVVAGGAAALLGFLTSFLVLRGRDLTRLMVTLGIAMLMLELANRERWLTGGADGLQGMQVGDVLGLFAFDLYGQTAYVYTVVVAFVLFFIARRVVNSPFGLSLRAVKSNALRTGMIGAPVDRRLVAIYTLGAAYAGVAGALLAQTTQFVSLDVLNFDRSAVVLLVLIIGGPGFLYGGFIGAIIYELMYEWLAGITAQYWTFWLGLALVVLVLFARDGLLGLAVSLRNALRLRAQRQRQRLP
jgi:branched-chain amino acid transport system permease protein